MIKSINDIAAVAGAAVGDAELIIDGVPAGAMYKTQ
jgi:hypothetical protein